MGRKFYLPLAFLFSLIVMPGLLSAQNGEIRGRIMEKGGREGVPFASVAALQSGEQIIATVTDLDGNYSLKPLTPGKYDVKVTCVGYSPAQTNGVLVTVDKISFVNMDMGKGIELKEAEATDYKIPLLDKGQTAVQKTTTYEEIQAAPLRDVNSVAAQSAGVFQRDEGKELNIRGSRSDGTAYYVDGIKVRGSSNITTKGAEQITVITGGVPAQYGDATGGIVAITTRGPSPHIAGGIEGTTSHFIDAYDNNVLSGAISGPILSSHDSLGKKTTVLGYFVSADWIYDGDPSPSAIGQWKVKDDILKGIEEKPYIKSPDGQGLYHRADYLTYDSMEHVKKRMNVANHRIAVNGKLDVRPGKNLYLSFGGQYAWNDNHSFTDTYSLMNYYNNPEATTNEWRVFARLQQRFGDQENQSKSASTIKNAFYSIQADYLKNTREDGNSRHKDKIFRYGYVGKFTSHKPTFYYDDLRADTANQWVYHQVYEEAYDSIVNFEPYALNPLTAAYTTQYYELVPRVEDYYQNLFDISDKGGLINGDNRVGLVSYGLWGLPGRNRNFYGKTEKNQFRISASGSADIKNHNIILGLEYEQREDRAWYVSANSLWPLMYAFGNSGLLNYELYNEVVNGPGDTTGYYHFGYDPTQNLASEDAKGFYENFRDKYGLSYHHFADIYSYAPEDFSLDMFSADELLNTGLVGYYGYDYKGNKTTDNPSITDFTLNKDKTNNFTRNIGAFRPIYVAGYIQDKFTYNEIVFNIGLRVDRYDANQPALKDKYLLYPAYIVGSSTVQNRWGGVIPGNIPSDAIVYVNNATSPSGNPIAYRDEDTWYDSQGNITNDVASIEEVSGVGIQPYIQSKYYGLVGGKVFSSDAFTDYEPQTSYMPRVAFSFPISDEAFFSAHYDVLTQRPGNDGTDDLNSLTRFDPSQYSLWAQGFSSTFFNSDLKPQRTTDYEITFQQKISRSAAFSLSAFYKEIKDMIELVEVQYAYPIDYSTYGNIDFGNVKGLTLSYDLRRTGNLRLKADYTLQFANGTGSDTRTNARLIAQGGIANIRTPKPLSFDQRHQISVSADYHYGKGKDYDGPVISNSQIFAEAGLNMTFRAGSGTPYTRKSNITPEAETLNAANGRFQLTGDINGSRLPWQFRVDAKVDKHFNVKTGKKANGENRRTYSLGVYLQVLNLLDARNVNAVYAATGSPSDDGYLSDPTAQKEINGQLSAQAYRDMYEIAVNNQDNYSLPRRIRVGVQIDF